jgi:NCAIR mutase (PurE)-related protein
MTDLRAVLGAVARGDLSPADAAERLEGRQDLGFATLDLQRARRQDHPEVIYGAGKTAAQISGLVGALADAGQDALVTRLDADKAALVCADHPTASWHPVARVLHRPVPGPRPEPVGRIAVVCAGTSDLPVAEECALVAEAWGNRVERHVDVGVAGLHRILSRADALRAARVVVVVAGMEGALPSVVGGLVAAPVIAVPTSVGYGASFGGLAALLGMLNSCAAGVGVVNIDNGFGAAVLASRINRGSRP